MADCRQILQDHFGPDFPNEAKKIADSIDRRISRGDNYTDLLKEINQDIDDAAFRTQNAAIDFVKRASTYQNIKNRIFSGNTKSKEWVKRFNAFLTGSTKKGRGFLNSVGTMQRSKFKTISGKIFSSLNMTPYGVRTLLRSKAFQDDLVKELYEGAGSTNNIYAQKVAVAVQDAKERLIVELNASGVGIRYRKDHVTTQWHDPYQMVKGGDNARQKWIDDTRGLLDWEKTLSGERAVVRAIDAGKITPDEYLGRVYDERVNKTKKYDTSKLRHSGPLSEQMVYSRQLIFKDSKAWLQYNKMYGHASPIHAIFNDIEIQSNRSVLIDYMGANPRETFEKTIDDIKSKMKLEGKELGRWAENSMRSRFANITGEAFIVGKPAIAKFVNIVTGINILSKLGKAALSSVTDHLTSAMTMTHMGENALTAYRKLTENIAKGVPMAERKYVYRMLGVGIDSILGSSASRFTINDAVPGVISDMVDKFFHLNGLNAWTDWSREAFSKMASMRMATLLKHGWNSTKSDFNKISDFNSFIKFRNVLEQYDINQRDWAKLQEIGSFRISDLVKNNPGMKGTTFPNERFITGDWVLEQGGPDVSRLSDKVNLFFVNESRIGIPDIGANERAIMMRTFQRGTLPGAVAQAFWQFRTYQVAVLTNLMPRMSEMGASNLGWHSAGALGLGYLSLSLKDLTKGLEPRDPFTKETFADSLRQSGVLGFVGDYMASEFGTYHAELDEEILGPVYSEFKSFIDLYDDMLDDGELGWQGYKVLKEKTPYQNIFWGEFALNYLINWHVAESFRPGYVDRLEDWYMFERGQDYIDFGIPPFSRPTDFIQEGGGFR